MRKSRRLLLSMSISMFICIVLSFILVDNSCTRIRQYVTMLLPFLKHKKEMLLNVILGIFASSFIAFWGFVFEAVEEKRKMRLFIKKTYQQVYFNLIPYINNLDYEKVRVIVVKSNLTDDLREILINYKYRYRIYQLFKKKQLLNTSADVNFFKYVMAIEVIETLHNYLWNIHQLYLDIKTHTFLYVDSCKNLKEYDVWDGNKKRGSHSVLKYYKSSIRYEEKNVKQLHDSLFSIKMKMFKYIRSLENIELNNKLGFPIHM